jgi:hypothetical protein
MAAQDSQRMYHLQVSSLAKVVRRSMCGPAHGSRAQIFLTQTRIRKVRCDEERPSCRRCTSTGRKCDGYDPDVVTYARRFKLETVTETKEAKERKEIAPHPGLISHPSRNAEELRSFHFFCSVTAPSFFGGFDQDLWNRAIPRACQVNPAVWHAVTSLGSLHERFIIGYDSHLPEELSDTRIHFGVQQFNQAVRRLLGNGDRRPRDAIDKGIVLTVCVLFTAICNLQGLQKQAFVHLRGGLKLLEEALQEPESSAQSIIPIRLIQPVFTSLDTQARAILDGETLKTWHFNPVDALKNVAEKETDVSFTPLELSFAAQSLFNNIIHSLQVLEETDPPPEQAAAILALHEKYRTHFEVLCAVLVTLKSSTPTLDRRAKVLVSLAEIDLVLGRMLLSLGPLKGDMRWDVFVPEFSKLLSLCSQVLALESENISRRPVFSPSANIVQSLWLLTARCRDPRLRRKAIELLEQYPRREGIWDSTVVARVAAMLVEIEETGSGWNGEWETRHATEIPLECRIRDVTVIYVTDRNARIIYRSHGDWNTGKRGEERAVAW